MSLPLMRYCVTSSAASCLLVRILLLLDCNCDVGIVVLAAVGSTNGEAVFLSGSGNDWCCCVVYHFLSRAVGGAIGGQGAVMVGAGDWSGVSCVDSASRPKSYSSCAAGGLVGWRYHASSNVA